MQHQNIKTALHKQLQSMIEQRIATAQQAIAAAKESRDNETKSSVGDKYETGRAMMQLEQERNEVQLAKAQTLKQQLAQVNFEKHYKNVTTGSLVITDKGNYFLAVGLGKMDLNGEKYFAISTDAPLGKVLLGKTKNDKVQFNNNTFTILKVA